MKTSKLWSKRNNKSFIKKFVPIALTALMLVSCGKDTENQIVATETNPTTNPDGYYPQYPNSQPTSPVIVESNSQYHWDNLKSQNACPYGNTRMQDLSYTLQAGAHQAQISGSLQAGNISGTLSQTFSGMNIGTKDLLFIAQVSNGSQVAYNVVVSLCSWSTPYGQEFIGPNAGLTNFNLHYMTLSQSTNCPTGKILDGWLSFTSQTYGGSIPTRFAPVSSSCY